MNDLSTLNAQELFRHWRSGNAQAGQVMAQRFSDWFYAVIVARLGDIQGRQPLARACSRFQQGIVSLTDPAMLVDWAHGILEEELKAAGSRVAGANIPNQATGGRPPSELLKAAASALPRQEVELLAAAYDATVPPERLVALAEAAGGMPVSILRARYNLKKWLAGNAQVAFQELPAEPNLDYAPLPLYEAGRMRSPQEEAGFEKWALTRVPLCRDLAEFSSFSLALREGAFRAALAPKPAPRPEPAPAPRQEPAPAPRQEAPRPAPAAPAKPAGGPPIALLGGVVVVGLLLLAVVAYFVMK